MPKKKAVYSASRKSCGGYQPRALTGGEHTALARAAIRAIEPLVDLFLELGITSPEAESLLRAVFVHRSRHWLSNLGGNGSPSDVRIALVSGVHRNFVKRLLAGPPRIAEARESKSRRVGRLLDAWHREPAYLDSSGKPRDLPERGLNPSFEGLVSNYVPGVSSAALIGELHRTGVIEVLANRRIRVRSRSMRVAGITAANLRDVGFRSSAYLRTLIRNLRNPRESLLSENLNPIVVATRRAPLVREVIYRRTIAFLQSLEAELESEQGRALESEDSTRLSISIFEPDEVSEEPYE